MAQVDPSNRQTELDAGPPRHELHDAPQIVVEVKKKKKRKYSKGLRAVQQIERGMARSMDVLAEGFARTFSEYKKRSGRSARNKKDGALRDGIENWTKAMSKGLSVSSKAPYDFVKTVNSGKGSKQVRRTIRALTPPPLR